MNPQRGAHMVGSGFTQGTGDADLGKGTGTAPDEGIGSAQSGYAGPENGPFECSNCIHFDGQGNCNQPQVVSDPEVNGQVDPEGCCNFFNPAHSENNEQEANEGTISTGEQP